MPFPSSRYEFSDDHIEIYVLPAGKKEVSLRYTDFDKLGEDQRFFYLFRDSYGGYMIPKEELGDEKEVTAVPRISGTEKRKDRLPENNSAFAGYADGETTATPGGIGCRKF